MSRIPGSKNDYPRCSDCYYYKHSNGKISTAKGYRTCSLFNIAVHSNNREPCKNEGFLKRHGYNYKTKFSIRNLLEWVDKEIKIIKDTPQFNLPYANVHVNGYLAIMQIELKTRLKTLEQFKEMISLL